jgi:AraC family transcriptional regulator
MSSPPPENRVNALVQGAQGYLRQLGGAGGRELEALARDALLVGLYHSPAYDLRVPGLPVARLSINLTSARVSGALEDDRARRYEAQRHSLFFTPAGAAVRWHKEAPSRHLNIYFNPEAFAADDHAQAARTPLFNGTLPGVRSLADALVEEIARNDAWAAEAADSLARLLLVRLLRRSTRATERCNALTPQLLARLRDHVMAHLSERILVSDMAAVVGLPVDRYAQAHDRLTGQTPHQFVMGLRLQRATELLAHTSMGLAEIAAECGFSSQQHLTHTMRLRLGTTPARFRLDPGRKALR